MRWLTVPLGDVAEVAAGGGAPQDQADFGSEGYPFVRAGSLKVLIAGGATATLERLAPAIATKHKLRLFPANTVLFAKSGMSASIGLVHRLQWPAYVVNHLAAVMCGEQLESAFLHHYLRAFSPSRLIQDAAYPSIRLGDIAGMKIPLPPVQEQRRIAAILDQAETLRAKRREALALLRSLRQSIFIEMFGDPVQNVKGYPTKPLSALVEPERGITYGIVQRGEDCDDGVPVLRIRDLVSDEIELRCLKRTSASISAQYRRTILRGGEIAISIRGTIGRCGIVPQSLAGGNVSREIALIPVLKDISADFVLEFLRSTAVQRIIAEDVKGVAQSGINLEDLRRVAVPLPGQVEMAAFVSRVAAAHRLIGLEIKAVVSQDELFASLQHRAFRGEL